jgi:hypothetical protein
LMSVLAFILNLSFVLFCCFCFGRFIPAFTPYNRATPQTLQIEIDAPSCVR